MKLTETEQEVIALLRSNILEGLNVVPLDDDESLAICLDCEGFVKTKIDDEGRETCSECGKGIL